MKGLTLNAKEQARLQILNAVLERRWSMAEAADVLVVSERHARQIVFQLAEVAIPRELFAAVLERITRLCLLPG